MNCVFCCSPKIIRFEIRNKVYGYCSSCGGYFLDNRFFLSPKEQKERYLLHDNSLENQGYRQFLKKFLDFSLPFIKEKDVILDYGSGPNPALTLLLEEYKRETLISSTVSCHFWDPFFAPDNELVKANVILCLEVAEHFENPLQDFKKLADFCLPDGFIVIGTQCVSSDLTHEKFKNWWYKEDATHVSFYSKKALQKCAESVGLELLKQENESYFVLRKTTDFSKIN